MKEVEMESEEEDGQEEVLVDGGFQGHSYYVLGRYPLKVVVVLKR